MEGRLCKGSDKVVCGVCSGLAEYLGIDPTIVRLLAVLLFVLSPAVMFILYIVACAIMPEKGPSCRPLAKGAGGAELAKELRRLLTPDVLKLILVVTGVALVIAGVVSSLTSVLTFSLPTSPASWVVSVGSSLRGVVLIIGGALLLLTATKVREHV